jgi:hypothetical protein
MKLGEYVRGLIDCVERYEPESAVALRRAAGDGVHRIQLDDEVIDVRFVRGRLHVRKRRRADGEGSTDRAVAYALLDGTLDFYDALDSGRLHLRADLDHLTRMWSAVEILLDASTRVPAMRELSRAFRGDRPALSAIDGFRRPDETETEIALLARLDLLNDVS